MLLMSTSMPKITVHKNYDFIANQDNIRLTW